MQGQTPFGGLTSDSHRLAIVRFLIYRIAQFSEKTDNDQFDNWLFFYIFRIIKFYILIIFFKWKFRVAASERKSVGSPLIWRWRNQFCDLILIQRIELKSYFEILF